MTTSEILTLLLASYGALVATVLALREIRRDRRRILVFLEYVAWVERAQITIVNLGNRPVTISEIGLSVIYDPDGQGHWEDVRTADLFGPEVGPNPLPIILTDGQHISLPLGGVVSEQLSSPRRGAKLVVYDIEGHAYSHFKTRTHDPKWGSYDKTP